MELLISVTSKTGVVLAINDNLIDGKDWAAFLVEFLLCKRSFEFTIYFKVFLVVMSNRVAFDNQDFIKVVHLASLEFDWLLKLMGEILVSDFNAVMVGVFEQQAIGLFMNDMNFDWNLVNSFLLFNWRLQALYL